MTTSYYSTKYRVSPTETITETGTRDLETGKETILSSVSSTSGGEKVARKQAYEAEARERQRLADLKALGERLKQERLAQLEKQRQIREEQLRGQTQTALRGKSFAELTRVKETPITRALDKAKGFTRVPEPLPKIDIRVSPTGTVTIGTTKYIGKAYIPELGMTANEYSRKMKMEAVKEGKIDIKDYGKTKFKGSLYWKDIEPEYKEYIKIDDKIKTDYSTYDPRTGMFIKPSPTGFGATGYMKPPTSEEMIKIEEAQYKGDLYGRTITAVPSQMISPWTTPMTEEEKKSITGFGYLDPTKHYDIFKASFDYDKDIKEAQETATKLEQLNKDFEGGKITYEKYSSRWDILQSNKAYQNIITSGERTTVLQDIARSKLSPTQRGVLSGVVGFADFGTYMFPPTRIIRGGEMISSGAYDLRKATTTREKLVAGGEMALGGVITYSGFKGISGGKTTGDLFPKWGGSRVGKVVTPIVSWGVPVGVTGLAGYGVYRQTGDIPVAVGYAVGGFVALKSPEIYSGFKKNWETIAKDKRGKAGKGAKQKQVQVKKTKKAKKSVKKKYEQVSREEYIFDKKGKTYTTKSFQGKLDKVRGDLNEMISSGNQKGISEYKKFLEQMYGKTEADKLFTEYLAQEGYGITPTEIQKVSTTTQKVQFIDPKIKTSPILKTDIKIKDKVKEKQTQFFIQPILTKQKTKQKLAQVFLSKQQQLQQQQQRQRVAQAFVQKSAQRAKQILKQIQITRQIPRPPRPPDPIPPTPIPPIPIPFEFDLGTTLKKAKRIVTDKEKFEVFVTKFGKDVEVGEFKTLEEAKLGLVKKLRTTLRAGAFITKDKKKIKAKKLGLFGREFRPSKIDPYKIIERKRRRIKKGTGEIREILGFRKKKSSKKKRGF